LKDKIKVRGKAGNLGELVKIGRVEKTTVTVEIHSGVISKRYVKYLTKKYLKKQQIRDWLRVISTAKGAYELRYFNIHNEDGAEAADDDAEDDK